MLNYNLNIIEPNNSGRRRNLLVGAVNYNWKRTIITAAGEQPPSIIFGTGSIVYIPYGPTTVFFSSSFESGPLANGSALGLPLNIAVTGSGVWPTTGSNILSIVIGGDLGFNQSTSSILSATLGNMNLSGSKISASFAPLGNQTYNIDFGVSHTKGNIYNPLVNWKVQNISSLSTSSSINGENTASFQIVKNTNEQLATVTTVTGSNSGSFNYLYNFGVTASLSASINNVTGSTTMSFSIPQEGVSQTTYFFNPNTTLAFGTGSFVATSDSVHSLTASIEFNKGNLSNSNINWKISSVGTNIAASSSFNIRKDANVTMATASFTASVSSSYTNNYAFNQTASISSSFVPFYNSDSSSYSIAKLNLQVTENGVNENKWISSSLGANSLTTLTSSFTATTGIPSYNISGSVTQVSIPVVDFLIVAGGGAGANMQDIQCYESYAGGGGAGGVISGSAILSGSTVYAVNVGSGGLANTNVWPGGALGSNGQNSSFNGLTAIGGGRGGGYYKCTNNNAVGGNGGSGGANGGLGTAGQGHDYVDNINGGGAGEGGDGTIWFNGIKYSTGGGGFGYNNVGLQYGAAGLPSAAGKGGDGRLGILADKTPMNGASGSVIIRYKSAVQRATGGSVLQSGSYFYHTFTSSGNFEIANYVNIFAVGGGAGAGQGRRFAAGGGGGAGAVISSSLAITTEPIQITIGSGGTGTNRSIAPATTASNGGQTIVSGTTDAGSYTITAGGGQKGWDAIDPNISSLAAGGAGGNSGTATIVINGVTTQTISAATGGTGIYRIEGRNAGGGGAGAYNNGANATGAVGSGGNGGDGGAGQSTIAGDLAGGGAGGGSSQGGPGSGSFGGGNGGSYGAGGGANATSYGAGGGGGGEYGSLPDTAAVGGDGSAGIVVISYYGSGSLATGGTITYNSGSNLTLHTFTASGQFTPTEALYIF